MEDGDVDAEDVSARVDATIAATATASATRARDDDEGTGTTTFGAFGTFGTFGTDLAGTDLTVLPTVKRNCVRRRVLPSILNNPMNMICILIITAITITM